ncbi:MAG TPA: hypothetical protein VLB84_01125, partial [Bacteroidia bacterium]|nr:hypothetical protein [Bacteroidia bacterium]
VLKEVLSNPNVGSVVTMCTPSATLDYNDLARTIIRTSKDSGKTMLAALIFFFSLWLKSNFTFLIT